MVVRTNRGHEDRYSRPGCVDYVNLASGHVLSDSSDAIVTLDPLAGPNRQTPVKDLPDGAVFTLSYPENTDNPDVFLNAPGKIEGDHNDVTVYNLTKSEEQYLHAHVFARVVNCELTIF